MTNWEESKTTFWEDFQAGIERMKKYKVGPRIKCTMVHPENWKECLKKYSEIDLNNFGLYEDKPIALQPENKRKWVPNLAKGTYVPLLKDYK